MTFSKTAVQIDAGAETERIVADIRRNVRQVLRRRGAVVGVSGGVDSAVVLSLCVRAFGADRVRAVFMPERDSDPESQRLVDQLCDRLGVVPVIEEITGALKGLRCYERRDEAIRRIVPEFSSEAGYRVRISLPDDLLNSGTLNVFLLTVVRP